MSQNPIILYPSNWLYNAGVVGLIRVLVRSGEEVSSILSQDGTARLDTSSLRTKLESPVPGLLPKPLHELPAWHWHFLQASFERAYGSVEEHVATIFQRAERGGNKKDLLSRLTLKSFCSEQATVDFNDINNKIKGLWETVFSGKGRAGRKRVTGEDEPSPQARKNAQGVTTREAMAKITSLIKIQEEAYIYRKAVGSLFSKGGLYQNLFNPNDFEDVKKFITDFHSSAVLQKPSQDTTRTCNFCCRADYKTEPVKSTQMSLLFPVFDKFPNAFWRNDSGAVTVICSLCRFIVLHHHLAFAELADGSEIFINAPSFEVMYHLNSLLKEISLDHSAQEHHSVREILGMSAIEFATKVQATLGAWTKMNIEVVTRNSETVDFFSLPYGVVQLLFDRRIASLLSQIGEFVILNCVLDQDFSRLMEIGYRLLRIGLKNGEWGKAERDFVNHTLRLERNRRNPAQTAEKIFKLCALIEEKTKRRHEYEWRSD
jgi:hypothetical protein